MYEIYQFLFVKGGPVMYPIVLGSVVALALFLERLWALRRERVIPPVFQRRLRVLLREDKLSEAEVLCQENASALANIVSAGLDRAGRPKSEVKEEITDVGRREVSHLERHVEFLGTIAAVEPLMGLLGTVTGLIGAFQRVESLASKGGGVNPGALAAGIWEALITTAAGLVVAIPAYVGYRYLQGRVNTLVVEMEEDALQIADLLSHRHRDGSGAARSERRDASGSTRASEQPASSSARASSDDDDSDKAPASAKPKPKPEPKDEAASEDKDKDKGRGGGRDKDDDDDADDGSEKKR
ncbi:MAG: MotA/TolQ/ExbB proton channel family protein [Myxococcales bacterium]|nr:MotA/TolQ/ExbB proton channel family protein [Myxococcales bacterium]